MSCCLKKTHNGDDDDGGGGGDGGRNRGDNDGPYDYLNRLSLSAYFQCEERFRFYCFCRLGASAQTHRVSFSKRKSGWFYGVTFTSDDLNLFFYAEDI